MKLINILPFTLLVTKSYATRSARNFQNHVQKPSSYTRFTQVWGENCGTYVEPTKRIVNGEEIHINKAPWQVYLSRGKKNGYEFCGGTIISNSWIVTAAHCEIKNMIYLYSATSAERPESNDKFGDNNYGSKSRKNWIRNPKYNDNTLMNDIALLKVNSNFAFNENRQPACLPLTNYCAVEGTILTVSGFGTSSSGGPGTTFLNQAEVPVRSSSTCNDPSISGYAINGGYIPYQAMFCAGGQTTNKDACQGDSGGPIVHKYDNVATLVGVVSWGYGCNEPEHPGVYTTVANYVYWIAQKTGVRVQDQDYDLTPPMDCDFDQDRGQTRSTEPNEGENEGGNEGENEGGNEGSNESYVNQLFASQSELVDAGFKDDPFKKGTLRMQGRCVDWNKLPSKTYANLQNKSSRKCKIYSKYAASYEEDSNRSFIKYDWNTMMITICPPGHRESDTQYCLASHPQKLSKSLRQSKSYRKNNKKYNVLYIQECDEHDNTQKFLIKKSGSRLIMAYAQNECVARTTYAGKQVLYTTTKKFRCKSAT